MQKLTIIALLFLSTVYYSQAQTSTECQQLNTIRGGGIRYKHAEIENTSIRIVDQTAIILDKIRLTAIVGGNEMVNLFMVTEVYVQTAGKWEQVSLSFTKLMGN